MNIRIDKYNLTSDAYQFILSETKINTKKDSKSFGEEYEVNKQYFPTLAGALNSLVGRRLRNSDATTLAGLRKDLKAIKSGLYALFFEKVSI